MRKAALEGVRKLIDAAKGGVLVTSRSHYFDSDEEMINMLGLYSDKAPVVMRCPEEFDEKESEVYLSQIGLPTTVPTWLPRKPLVFQVLSQIESSTASQLLASDDGEFTFWGRFLTTVCEREARIHGSLDADAIKEVLLNLAEISRQSDNFLGRLSIRNVRDAYERAIHDAPDQAAEQMLARLCTLGRVAPESPERQFVDAYIVDGLRAEALLRSIDNQADVLASEMWRQPLSKFGWDLVYNSLVAFDKVTC